MKKKKASDVIFTLVIFIFLGVFVFALYNFLMEYIPRKQARDRFKAVQSVSLVREDTSDYTEEELAEYLSEVETEEVDPEDEEETKKPRNKRGVPYNGYRKLYEMNHYFVGWIKVDGTNIDYPVVCTPDEPEHYLRIDFNDNSATCGTPFIGEGCTVDSDSFIIYGHNMNDKSMFGTLDRYKEEEFWKEHKNFTFNTLTEDREYEIFAAFETQIASSAFPYYQYVGEPNEEDFNTLVSTVKEDSLYQTDITPKYGDKIIMLSTCSYHANAGRFVVAAVEITKEDE